MIKKSFVTLALAAKALALAAAIMLYASSAPADTEDCHPCVPPPCQNGECEEEES